MIDIGVVSILVAILVFGVIIFVHELGHFMTAKMFGVQVNEFSIGMGPRLLKFGKGETEYSLRLLPIGGFCAMEGEDGGEDENPRAFHRKAKWKRAIILVAGGFMNIVLGFVVMYFMTATQPLLSTTIISGFDSQAVSNQVHDGGDALQQGDKILKINNTRCNVDTDIVFELMRAEDGKVDMLVERDGQQVQLRNVQFATEIAEGTETSVVRIDFTVYGRDNTLSHLFDTQGRSFWGHVGHIFVSIGEVAAESFFKTVSIVKLVWVSLIDIITGKYGLNELAGPVGTTSAIGEAASAGLSSLLMIAVFITINLGIVNLLPFPALDGGRVVLLGLEAIRRKPLSPKVEGAINLVGFGLLMVLIVVVSFNDIARLISGG